MPPVSKQLYSKMKTLIVLFCAAATQGAVYLPHAYHAAAAYPVHGVAKSTITYKTAAWEPVDATTPPATYAALPAIHHAALPAIHALPAAAPAISYSLGGVPFVIPATYAAHPASPLTKMENQLQF